MRRRSFGLLLASAKINLKIIDVEYYWIPPRISGDGIRYCCGIYSLTAIVTVPVSLVFEQSKPVAYGALVSSHKGARYCSPILFKRFENRYTRARSMANQSPVGGLLDRKFMEVIFTAK